MSQDGSESHETSRHQQTEDVHVDIVLASLTDNEARVGTLRTLAQSFGLTVPALRTSLRTLLEADQIIMRTGPHGQLTIQRARAVSPPLPALAPRSRSPRRGSERRVWIM